ncbi:MAG: (d)CMP kinase [Roseburia sp.]|nr:(d)CMP kinase [Roseburia sp.]MCM1097304.1 (d)CMP kinase [Ruminococcus flavefaciens]
MTYNIAIDGPAGAGKSTIARAVAERLKLVYVDTGAMYRALTVAVLRQGIDPQDREAVIRCCLDSDVTIRYEDGEQVVYLNGENVNPLLRTEEVGSAASSVSVIPRVREKLVELQRRLAAESDCIMDGRDIGTCVLPRAQTKIYLTADSGVRAKRRYDELKARGEDCDLERIKADIEERDYRDMHREVSPLRQAEDAVLVDTSDMTVDEVIDRILELCKVCKDFLSQ